MSALSGPICEIVTLIWSKEIKQLSRKVVECQQLLAVTTMFKYNLNITKKNLNKSKKVIAFSVNSVRPKTLNGKLN